MALELFSGHMRSVVWSIYAATPSAPHVAMLAYTERDLGIVADCYDRQPQQSVESRCVSSRIGRVLVTNTTYGSDERQSRGAKVRNEQRGKDPMTEAARGGVATPKVLTPRQRSGVPGPLRRLTRATLRAISLHENVQAGDDLRIGRGVVVSSPHGLVIGDHVSIGPRTLIQVDGSIGDFCLIGMGVQICGRHDHALDQIGIPIALSTWVGDRDQRASDTVTIGTDVWIGGGSTILSGVTIGSGAVIGAGSVVTHDVESFAIVAGSPARQISIRFRSDKERDLHLRRLRDLAQGSLCERSRIELGDSMEVPHR